jgi:hypothetical protein
MKILNRENFLLCPAGTVFFDYKPQVFGGLSIKTCEPKPLNRNNGYPDDFFRIDIDTVLNVGELGRGESCGDTYEAISLLERAEAGEQVDLHFDGEGRDGIFDEDARFAVLDPEDVQRLIASLVKSGSDSPADKRLALVSDERDAARFDAHCLRQEKEQLRRENERLRTALRGLVDAVSQDLPRGLDDAYAVAVQSLQKTIS